MYLRFQGVLPNPGTASKLGIFQLAFQLRDQHELPAYAHAELQRNLEWLKVHLDAPDILDLDEHFRAICWFKPEAHEPLARIWPIKFVLDDFGYRIDLIKASDPGCVIYEDGWQIAAKPRRAYSPSAYRSSTFARRSR